MKVILDRDLCCGAGQCVLSAPEVFDQDEDGIARLLVAEPAPEQHGGVHEAALVCPRQAIDLTD
ncbi:ferredoxin [Micromonospora haikouensis]|uniref:ferredoxin n=1 Tax=Micromonospora haikouensis TaxID=686309 RepID=UPI0037A39EB6